MARSGRSKNEGNEVRSGDEVNAAALGNEQGQDQSTARVNPFAPTSSTFSPDAEVGETAPGAAAPDTTQPDVSAAEPSAATVPTADSTERDEAWVAGLGDVDAVTSLRVQISSLQASVAELAQRPVVEVEPELLGASKTLRYAQQTADAVMEDARERAAELVAEAERQRSEIIRAARDQAERDYGAERDRVRAEAAAWESRRSELTGELASLSAVIGRYHDGLRALEDRIDLAAESLSGAPTPAAPQPAPQVESAPQSSSAPQPSVVDLTSNGHVAGPSSTDGAESAPADESADAD